MNSGTVSAALGIAIVVLVLCQSDVDLISAISQVPRVHSRADLVQVDVSVIDDTGRPLRGLGPRDFTILDRDRPQSIVAFEEINRLRDTANDAPLPPADVPADVSDNVTASADRVVLLVIDDWNIWKDRARVVQDLTRKIVIDLGRDVSMGVLFASGRDSVELTTDRARVLRAVEMITGEFHTGRVRGGCDPRLDPRGCKVFKTIQNAARALEIDNTRRKAFVLISEGYSRDILGLFETMSARTPVNAIENRKTVPWHDYVLLDMMEALRRANATLYAVDPRGPLRTSQERNRESRGATGELRMFDPLYVSQEGLRLMTDASGGFAVVDTHELTGGVTRILEDLDNYYLLGFYPDRPRDGKWNDISVTVGRPGVTVRHRKGYRLERRILEPRDKDPLIELAAGAMPRSDLSLRSFATTVSVAEKTPRVAVAVEVRAPWGTVTQADGTARDSLTATLLAVDLNKKKVTKRLSRQSQIVIHRPRISSSGDVTYVLGMAIDLPAGRYQLRSSVKSERVGKAGSVYVTLDVPQMPKSGVAIIGLALDSHKNPIGQSETLGSSALPFQPVFDRVFRANDTVRVVYWLASSDSSRPVPSLIEIIDSQGVVALTEAVPPATGTASGTIALNRLVPGAYRLRVSAGTAAREIGFAINN